MLTREDVSRATPIAAPSRPAARTLFGGAEGNGRLTALAGVVLLVLLAVEGATVPFIGQLLSIHIFVGMLLLGPVALKLATTGYRVLRYYTGAGEYVRLGPPPPLMRLLVAPVLILSTLTLFATGVTLLFIPHRGTMLGLHKASFIVWVGALSIHVLAYGLRAGRRALAEIVGALEGRAPRLLVIAVAVAVGVAIAILTYPHAGPWLHSGIR
jgi:hypothetical protein